MAIVSRRDRIHRPTTRQALRRLRCESSFKHRWGRHNSGLPARASGAAEIVAGKTPSPRENGVNIAGHITLLVHPGMVTVLASLIQMLADGLREISIETDIVH